MVGIMIPPSLRPAQSSLFVARKKADKPPIRASGALTPSESPNIGVPHPAGIPEPEMPTALPLAA
jgi:hypothetical protein